MTELELSAAVENAHRLAGHEGIFFMRHPDFFMSRGPIGSGENLSNFSGVVYSVTGVGLSPAVPAGPSRKRIETGDFVVVDIPTLVGGYHADQTRTYCVGKARREMVDLYDALKEIADYVIGQARPGIRCSDLFHMAEAKARECLADGAFLSFGNGKRSHMIGHGVGLELSEPPIISKNDHSLLGEDDVIAVEVHVMREGVGVIKIEDMIHIGSQANEILTKSPRILFEVEE
jgi:Xaa-Pro aminopeptidase